MWRRRYGSRDKSQRPSITKLPCIKENKKRKKGRGEKKKENKPTSGQLAVPSLMRTVVVSAPACNTSPTSHTPSPSGTYTESPWVGGRRFGITRCGPAELAPPVIAAALAPRILGGATLGSWLSSPSSSPTSPSPSSSSEFAADVNAGSEAIFTDECAAIRAASMVPVRGKEKLDRIVGVESGSDAASAVIMDLRLT